VASVWKNIALSTSCPFDTFADIQREAIKIAKIDEEKIKGQGLPSNFNPRVNLWSIKQECSPNLRCSYSPRREDVCLAGYLHTAQDSYGWFSSYCPGGMIASPTGDTST